MKRLKSSVSPAGRPDIARRKKMSAEDHHNPVSPGAQDAPVGAGAPPGTEPNQPGASDGPTAGSVGNFHRDDSRTQVAILEERLEGQRQLTAHFRDLFNAERARADSRVSVDLFNAERERADSRVSVDLFNAERERADSRVSAERTALLDHANTERMALLNHANTERTALLDQVNQQRADTLGVLSQTIDRFVQLYAWAASLDQGAQLVAYAQMTLFRIYDPHTSLSHLEAEHEQDYRRERNRNLLSRQRPPTLEGRVSLPARLPTWANLPGEFDRIGKAFFTHFRRGDWSGNNKIPDLPDTVRNNPRVADEPGLYRLWEYRQNLPMILLVGILQKELYIDHLYKLGTDITFKERARDLAVEADRRPNADKFRPDRYCAFKKSGETTETIAFVVEYKAPQAISAERVRGMLAAIQAATPAQRASMGGQEEFLYCTLTQVYNYMLEGQVAHGCLVTGDFIIFLERGLEEGEPALYHWLTIPEKEKGIFRLLRYSNVFQHLAFVIYTMNFASRAETTPPDNLPAPGSGGAPPSRHDDAGGRLRSRRTRSRNVSRNEDNGMHTRLRPRPTQSRGAMGSGTSRNHGQHRSQYHRSRHSPRVETPDSVTGNEHDSSQNQELMLNSVTGSSSLESIDTHRGYCTQKCLLGLLSGDVLDNECPNVGRHRAGSLDDHHPLDHGKCLHLLSEQLSDNFHAGVVPLNRVGATGVAFRVTLLSHGYTFVGKAAIRGFGDLLQREIKVYDRLRAVQGLHVPVFLGHFRVDVPQVQSVDNDNGNDYLLSGPTSWIFMSWGGRNLTEMLVGMAKDTVKHSVLEALDAIHAHGVGHFDVRYDNVLWSEEGGSGQAVLIDFGMSVLYESAAQAPIANTIAKRALSASSEEKDVNEAMIGIFRKDFDDAADLFVTQRPILNSPYILPL